MSPAIEDDEEEDIPSAKNPDRTDRKKWKQYMLENPFYMQDVLGKIYTEPELDRYIELNRSMFSDPSYFIKRRL